MYKTKILVHSIFTFYYFETNVCCLNWILEKKYKLLLSSKSFLKSQVETLTKLEHVLCPLQSEISQLVYLANQVITLNYIHVTGNTNLFYNYNLFSIVETNGCMNKISNICLLSFAFSRLYFFAISHEVGAAAAAAISLIHVVKLLCYFICYVICYMLFTTT